MRSGNFIARFGYSDGIGILGLGRTILDSAASAKREVDNWTHWAHQNVVLFDAEKLEVAQFPGSKKKETTEVLVSGNMIQLAEYIRCLGIYLDPHLSFKQHVSK